MYGGRNLSLPIPMDVVEPSARIPESSAIIIELIWEQDSAYEINMCTYGRERERESPARLFFQSFLSFGRTAHRSLLDSSPRTFTPPPLHRALRCLVWPAPNIYTRTRGKLNSSTMGIGYENILFLTKSYFLVCLFNCFAEQFIEMSFYSE